MTAGIVCMQVLHRLTLGVQPAGPDDAGDSSSNAEASQSMGALGGGALSGGAFPGTPLSQSVQRNSARLLAILTENDEALVRVVAPLGGSLLGT